MTKKLVYIGDTPQRATYPCGKSIISETDKCFKMKIKMHLRICDSCKGKTVGLDVRHTQCIDGATKKPITGRQPKH